MSEKEKPTVDSNTAEFKQGVEAGLNSEENTNNWKAGNELGQELKEKSNTEKSNEDVPLYLRGGSAGNRGNAQDEKDKTSE